jgi:hypothetical protein
VDLSKNFGVNKTSFLFAVAFVLLRNMRAMDESEDQWCKCILKNCLLYRQWLQQMMKEVF